MYNIRHTTILIPTYKKTCYRNQMHITGPTPTLISASVQLLRNPCFRSDLFMTAFTLLLKYISAERPKILVEIFCSLFPILSLIIPCQISQSFSGMPSGETTAAGAALRFMYALSSAYFTQSSFFIRSSALKISTSSIVVIFRFFSEPFAK